MCAHIVVYMWFCLQRMLKTEHPTPNVVLLTGIVTPSYTTASVSMTVKECVFITVYLRTCMYMCIHTYVSGLH